MNTARCIPPDVCQPYREQGLYVQHKIFFSIFIVKFSVSLLSNFTFQQNESGKVTVDLSEYEYKVYSQSGEDGVILAILNFIGPTKKYYVEFGASDALECNTRLLREKYGWNGLLMDGFHYKPEINLQRSFITAENINSLFEKYEVPSSAWIYCRSTSTTTIFMFGMPLTPNTLQKLWSSNLIPHIFPARIKLLSTRPIEVGTGQITMALRFQLKPDSAI